LSVLFPFILFLNHRLYVKRCYNHGKIKLLVYRCTISRLQSEEPESYYYYSDLKPKYYYCEVAPKTPQAQIGGGGDGEEFNSMRLDSPF
jgi:hypothetical protein